MKQTMIPIVEIIVSFISLTNISRLASTIETNKAAGNA